MAWVSRYGVRSRWVVASLVRHVHFAPGQGVAAGGAPQIMQILASERPEVGDALLDQLKNAHIENA